MSQSSRERLQGHRQFHSRRGPQCLWSCILPSWETEGLSESQNLGHCSNSLTKEVFVLCSCVTCYHILNSLEQHTFIISQFPRDGSLDMAQLAPLFGGPRGVIKGSAGPHAHLEVWLEKNQPWKSLTLLAGFIFLWLWKSGWLASSRLAGIRMTLLRVIQI